MAASPRLASRHRGHGEHPQECLLQSGVSGCRELLAAGGCGSGSRSAGAAETCPSSPPPSPLLAALGRRREPGPAPPGTAAAPVPARAAPPAHSPAASSQHQLLREATLAIGSTVPWPVQVSSTAGSGRAPTAPAHALSLVEAPLGGMRISGTVPALDWAQQGRAGDPCW